MPVEWFKRNNDKSKEVDEYIKQHVFKVIGVNNILIKWTENITTDLQTLSVHTRWNKWNDIKIGIRILGNWSDISAEEFKSIMHFTSFKQLCEPSESDVLSWNTVTNIVNSEGCSRYSVYQDIKYGHVAIKYKGKWRLRDR